MPFSTPIQTMNDKEARLLGRQIAKDSNSVRIKYGKTNGEAVLHVFVPGNNELGHTIKNAAEWAEHPANERTHKERNETKDAADDDLIVTRTSTEGEVTRTGAAA